MFIYPLSKKAKKLAKIICDSNPIEAYLNPNSVKKAVKRKKIKSFYILSLVVFFT